MSPTQTQSLRRKNLWDDLSSPVCFLPIGPSICPVSCQLWSFPQSLVFIFLQKQLYVTTYLSLRQVCHCSPDHRRPILQHKGGMHSAVFSAVLKHVSLACQKRDLWCFASIFPPSAFSLKWRLSLCPFVYIRKFLGADILLVNFLQQLTTQALPGYQLFYFNFTGEQDSLCLIQA